MGCIGVPLQIFAVEIRAVRLALPQGGGDRSLGKFSRHVHAQLLRLFESDQHGGIHETRRAAGRLFRLGSKVVIPPAAVDRSVTAQQIDLPGNYRLDPLAQNSVLRPAAMQSHQGLYAITVGPDVIQGVRAVPAQLGKFSSSQACPRSMAACNGDERSSVSIRAETHSAVTAARNA